MEAVPRLPMLSFDLKTSPESPQFGPALKQYIASFYNEDPESYNAEISKLESLRGAAVRPSIDVGGCQLLKKYYCQLHFLKSRFPMQELQGAAVYFSWKDCYANMPCTVPDIRFELMCVLFNIGALHTQLGAVDSRSSAEGLKMACTHFQCAAWAFQTVKETYYQMIPYITSLGVIQFMQQVCLAQAQECILEKSMMDNRKAAITTKVAVQVVDHYKRALSLVNLSGDEENSFSNFVSSKMAKEWAKYLSFKIAYHKCIALLFQGQQAEEQQKMGERVAFYQAACEQLDEARKLSSGVKQQKDLMEAIAFTSDVVEGKRKAAKNENEFIYHEEVPERHALQEVKGASLVKGIAFSVNDPEVSGDDIFARLVPMEAHEASSLYSEKKAQKLRQMADLVEGKDQALAEFMSSLQLDVFSQMRQANGLPQDLIDRAAALSAKPNATQELVSAMSKLSNSYQEVESMLNEIQELLKEEDENEKLYQETIGKRPPSIITTDLSREAAKYREAHNKANESNENLHRAMMSHAANLKILGQPLKDLQKHVPSVDLPNSNVDDGCLREIEGLMGKVEEMRNQRAMLWGQYREALHKDDITGVLVTRQPDQGLDQLFQEQLEKHQELGSVLDQNMAAQENILKAFVEAYAKAVPTRRFLQDVVNRRSTMIGALITSFDAYEDLLAKANKGIEFYEKLETNVSKLLQRIKSTMKVQQEERDQMMKSTSIVQGEEVPPPTVPTLKLKDYLESRKKGQWVQETPAWPRPTPLGSEINEPIITKPVEQANDSLAERMANLKMNQNKQAFTRTTDMYVPIPSSQHAGSFEYYQQYYVSQPEKAVVPTYIQSSTNIPTYIASTPVQPNYGSTNEQSLSSTNISSYVPQYIAPNVQPSPAGGTIEPHQSSTNINSYVPQYIAPNVQPSPAGSTIEPHQSSTNINSYVPQYIAPNVSIVSQPAGSTDDQNLSSTNYIANEQNIGYYPQYNDPYYPPNYGHQPYQASEAYTYNPSPEYATSVRPDTFKNFSSSTYSSPIPDIKSSTASVNNYVMSNGQNYPSYDSTGQYQYYYANSASTKTSNVDLLTGLDFTVNQAILVPQQPVEEVPKPEVAPPVKEEVIVVVKPEKVINRKPLNNTEVKKLFELELDRFEKFLDVLTNKTLSGPTNLELKWKEILDRQELDKKAISVARCYPMKNRYPDILPYDHTRVELRSTKDDYINASFVKDISYYSAPFIITQAPLTSTILDFWTMITEQQAELVVSALGDQETGSDVYWPNEKGRELMFPNMVISLISKTAKPHWIERLISINFPEKRDSRVIIHLQFTSWPGSLFPTTPEPFVSFITETIDLFLQQRSTTHPIVVHCGSGIGRSGLICLLVAAILEVTSNPVGIPDLVSLSVKLAACRKNTLRDREHLKFAYEAFLVYMKQVLAQGQTKRILNEVGGVVKVEENVVPVEMKADDPLSSLDPFWASKKK